MNGLLNAMRAQAMLQFGSLAVPRVGTVTSYDPANYCAKVKIQPDGHETGWLPILSPWVGDGWGMFAPPSIGDLVEISFQESDWEVGFVTLRAYNDKDRPLSVPSGEFWLVHQSGSLLKFKNNGDVEVHADATMTMTAGDKIRIAAPTVEVHATALYKWDVNGRGEKNYEDGVETWKDNDVTKPHHNHAPPEI